MRIWFRLFKNNHLIQDTVIEDNSPDTRTHRITRALEECCYQFDLGKPFWLDLNIRDFKRNARCRFTPDNFIEEFPFDYLEMRVIEE